MGPGATRSEAPGRGYRIAPRHGKTAGREVPSLSAVGDIVALPVSGDDLVRVTPGEYAASYVRHAGVTVFTSPKVRVDLRLLTHPDLILSRWYRVTDYRGGRIRAGRHSDIVRELSAVLGRRVRHDRISVTALEGVVVNVEVCDVIQDRKQRKLAEVNRYSVVSRLLRQES